MKLVYRGAEYQAESGITTAESDLAGKYRGTEITFSAPISQSPCTVLRYRGLRYIG